MHTSPTPLYKQVCTYKMNQQSMYDIAQSYENVKMESDVIYNAFMNKDSTELDKMIKEILDITNTKFPDLSTRFKEMTTLTLTDKSRVSKHALLMFGLYLTPEYAKTLVSPRPKVDPNKFKHFYMYVLPDLCQKHLNGHFTSLQEFVEYIRPAYIEM